MTWGKLNVGAQVLAGGKYSTVREATQVFAIAVCARVLSLLLYRITDEHVLIYPSGEAIGFGGENH